jgi:predicted permease
MRGRDLVEQDNESATKVAVINAHMAQRLWPGQNPLGKRFRFGREGDFIEVAGVARDGRYVMLGEEPRPFFYLPFQQHYSSPVTLHVRTVNNPAGVLPAIRQALRQLDPHLPIYDVRTMEDHLRASAFALMPLRMGATLAGVQGLLGLLLAVMGIYGVVSYVVSQRTREIGIRMALGAQTFDIIRAVVREGLHLTLYGIGIGLTAAMALVHFLRTLLYGVNPTDALVFTGVTILLASAALLACYVPARRATKVDPMVALRYE